MGLFPALEISLCWASLGSGDMWEYGHLGGEACQCIHGDLLAGDEQRAALGLSWGDWPYCWLCLFPRSTILPHAAGAS